MNEVEQPAALSGTVVRGVGISGVGILLMQALTLGFYLVLARTATPEDFGLLAAAWILVGVGYLFTESGMLAALIQRRDRIEEAANTAVIATAVGGVVVSALAAAAAPVMGAIFQDPEVTKVSAAVSGLLLLRAFAVVPDALLQRRFSFVRRTTVEPLAIIAFGSTAVVLTAQGHGVWGLVAGHYAFALTELVLAWAFVRWRPRLRLASFAMWRELIAYGRHVIAGGIFLRAGEQADRLVIGRFVGVASLGQYSYALRIAATPYLVALGTAAWVLFPAFSRIAEHPERFRPAFLRALFWSSAIGMPAGLILLAIGEPLTVLVFGDAWREAGQATMALCLFAGPSVVTAVTLEGAKASGRPQINTRVHAATAAVAIAVMVALLPLGLVGVSMAVSVAAIVGAGYAIRLFSRASAVGLRPMIEQIWPAVLASATMVAVVIPLERLIVDAQAHGSAVGLALLCAEGLLGATIYLVTLNVLVPGSAADLRGLAATMVKRLRPSGTRT